MMRWRARWSKETVTALFGLLLLVYFFVVYRPLSSRVAELDQPLKDVWANLAMTNLVYGQDNLLQLGVITNRYDRVQDWLDQLQATNRFILERFGPGKDMAERIQQPFKLLDFQFERFNRLEQIKKDAEQKKIDLAADALSGFPEHAIEMERPKLAWGQLLAADRMFSAAIQSGVDAVESFALLPVQEHLAGGDQQRVRLSELPMQIKVRGSMESVYRFLAGLALFPEELEVLKIPKELSASPLMLPARLLLRKSSAANPNEVTLDLRASAFLSLEMIEEGPEKEPSAETEAETQTGTER